mmetsp:Transcript_28566/g.58380  ORF Transcript_28566/g.58380 Transcript_28566/m.58380 type:complete len:446 (+) Transcript_28566:231-1568(+)
MTSHHVESQYGTFAQNSLDRKSQPRTHSSSSAVRNRDVRTNETAFESRRVQDNILFRTTGHTSRAVQTFSRRVSLNAARQSACISIFLWCWFAQDVSGKKCATAVVPRPIIGECIEVFSQPVTLRVCEENSTTAADRIPAISDTLAIADLSPFANLATSFVNQQCKQRWQHWPVPPDFMHVCYGGTKDLEPCEGLKDFYTCTLGTCVRLLDRQDWPADWWQRVAESQFGGYTPTLYDTRVWYCADNPGFPLGEIEVGNGRETFYARSSNPWIKHECDLVDDLGNPLPNPDAQCENVTAAEPVTLVCCGACMLNNAHLMRMWNCTGLTELVGNDFAINVLAWYCKRTMGCVEERPCQGDPVVMGDPKVLFDPATYSVECDQLDSGCDPVTSRCKFRYACDNSIEALRERLGYYEVSAGSRLAPAPSPISRIWGLLLSCLCVVVWRV